MDLFNFFVMGAAILSVGCASSTTIGEVGRIIVLNTAQNVSQFYRSLKDENVYRPFQLFLLTEAVILPLGCASGTIIGAAIRIILLRLRNTAQNVSKSYQSLKNENVYTLGVSILQLGLDDAAQGAGDGGIVLSIAAPQCSLCERPEELPLRNPGQLSVLIVSRKSI